MVARAGSYAAGLSVLDRGGRESSPTVFADAEDGWTHAGLDLCESPRVRSHAWVVAPDGARALEVVVPMPGGISTGVRRGP